MTAGVVLLAVAAVALLVDVAILGWVIHARRQIRRDRAMFDAYIVGVFGGLPRVRITADKIRTGTISAETITTGRVTPRKKGHP